MIETVQSVAAKRQIEGVIATYEQYVLPAAKIAAHLHVPALPVRAARACTDKSLMRQLFAKAPEKISPDFTVVHNVEEVQVFADTHRFPLILKPANLSKSLLVSKCSSMEELLETYARTRGRMGAVYAKYAPHTNPKLIVEEFMEGSVHSVDAFVDNQGIPHVLDAVVDYETGYEVGYDDNFHYSRLLPSRLSVTDIAAIRHVAEVGCQALGMKNSPAHIEIILTKDGPRIVEIGARNGGYRSRMHALADGIDIIGNNVRIACGQQPDVTTTKHEYVGVFELFPKEPGLYKGLRNENALRDLKSLCYFGQKVELGEFVGKSSDGFKACAIIILHAASEQQFLADTAFLREKVSVTTREAN